MCDSANMTKARKVRSPGTIHARAGCKLSVHGREKRSHKDAGCTYVTHGPTPLSKLITSLSVQKRKRKKKKRQQTFNKRHGTPVLHDDIQGFINKILETPPSVTVRRSGRNRRVPRRFVQEGSGKKSNHMHNLEQARLIYQRRYGNPWMSNGYVTRL